MGDQPLHRGSNSKTELLNLVARNKSLETAFQAFQKDCEAIRAATLALADYGRLNQSTNSDAGNSARLISQQSPRLGNGRGSVQIHRRQRRMRRQICFSCFTARTGVDQMCKTHRHVKSNVDTVAAFALSQLDPFDTLPIDSVRLQLFLTHRAAKQAGEGVFALKEDNFQSFGPKFNRAIGDPGLLNAFMLSFAFATNGGIADAELLEYKSKTIHFLNKRLCRVEDAATDGTICTILLLMVVESRLGLRACVQTHLAGIQHLMDLCIAENVRLDEDTERAIFWQDLVSAVLTGSERIACHDTFPGMQWSRDPQFNATYVVPPGFESNSIHFNNVLKPTFEDLHSLQVIRDSPSFQWNDSQSTLRLDSHQAWIESRLFNFMKALDGSDPVLDCCLTTAYLCSYIMFTEIWAGNLIPAHCSLQLLRKLQRTSTADHWLARQNLLLWLLCMGGGFAPHGVIRTEYTVLLNETYARQSQSLSWLEVEERLKTFIWSETTFREPCKTFWEESFW